VSYRRTRRGVEQVNSRTEYWEAMFAVVDRSLVCCDSLLAAVLARLNSGEEEQENRLLLSLGTSQSKFTKSTGPSPKRLLSSLYSLAPSFDTLVRIKLLQEHTFRPPSIPRKLAPFSSSSLSSELQCQAASLIMATAEQKSNLNVRDALR